MVNHIVDYDENESGTQSWAKCSCSWKGPRRSGGADQTHAQLDRDAEGHLDQQD